MNAIYRKAFSISLLKLALSLFVMLFVQGSINANPLPNSVECGKEGEFCRVSVTGNVSYGAGDNWITKTVTNGTTCDVAEFGGDPAPNIGKECYLSYAPARKLQMVYVVPKGQTAKPRAAEALSAIALIIQRHYFEQLGVTFQLENPLVSTVQLDQDVTYAVDWNNNVAMVKKNFYDGYVTNENVVFTVIEGAVGDGGGSWNIVKIPGKSFFDDAYATFINNPAMLPNKLHGFSHELGHAFGLMHSEDAKTCFQKLGITLDTSKSLIMQKKGDLGAVYNYPFLPQEKRLLLEPDYSPGCRPLLSEPGAPPRPHASLHLKYKLNTATAPRSITFKNEAGYVAKMMVQYFELNAQSIPIPKILFTDNIPVGQSKTLDIPASASNMPITVNLIGTGTMKNNLFSTNLDAGFTGNRCFKAWGTLFSPQGGNCQ